VNYGVVLRESDTASAGAKQRYVSATERNDAVTDPNLEVRDQ